LNKVKKVVKLVGFVNSESTFIDQPKVSIIYIFSPLLSSTHTLSLTSSLTSIFLRRTHSDPTSLKKEDT